MTGRLANLVFVVRAVDVNEAVARVGVVFLEAIEPEDAREDEIIGRRRRVVRRERDPAAENRAAGKRRRRFFRRF